MPVDICIALRALLTRTDLTRVRYEYDWKERLHRITAEREQIPFAGGEPGLRWQQFTISDKALERLPPTAGERLLKRQAKRLLTEEEIAKDAG